MEQSCGLDPFFYPRSIAVVGASQDVTKPSGIILKNLLHAFKGIIYPVNPNHTSILGVPCFPSVSDIPDDVSLSVCITPTATIPSLLREHAGKGIHHIIIATAGFAETEGGEVIQSEIKEIAGNAGIRIIGPNCLGIFHPSAGLDTFFLPYDRVPRPQSGNISLISQSGSILGTTLILLEQEGLGVSKAVSYGNRVDVGETELIKYLSDDDETGVIGICIESIGDGRGFISAAQRCTKPMIVLKLGQQPAGKKASRSHTGSMAGRYEIFQAAFRRSGIHEANTLEEFIDLLKTFSLQKPHTGKRVLIVTNAGGIGVMTADLCNKEGLLLPDLPVETKDRLRSLLPPYYALSNPIDLTGNSTDKQFVMVLEECLNHYDAALLIPFMTVPGITQELGKLITNTVRDIAKPVVSLNPFSGNGKRLENTFRQSKIPVFPTPIRMVKSAAALLKNIPAEPFPENIREYPLIKGLIKGPQPVNSKDMLDAMSIKYPDFIFARSQKEALTGVVVQEMAPSGIEVIIGSIKDPDFGPVVMFGLGGIFTEIIKDTVFDIAPITHNGALRMIEAIRGYEILRGIRGARGVGMGILADTIVKVSEVATLFPDIVELEFNPAVAYPDGIIVVDVKIIYK
ncbi:MAG: acetate--CoA ligase family protein [Nitrospirae bacterium]|nr:acetate--CoA ligase family protein [Nitrospirota bacterium]